MHVKYNTKGTCAVRIEFDVEDGVVKNIAFLGGRRQPSGVCRNLQ